MKRSTITAKTAVRPGKQIADRAKAASEQIITPTTTVPMATISEFTTAQMKPECQRFT